ncbi:helitron_like_N domain-containing protein [Trichonephila clavata]|uniref:Helitron_like_N domain-containing protein n=1 Tax=Trichonephila clavata TaxID=2740835 RepID=A0A8X6LUX2_TRICU|nr:helitron_like_N domain-containing protein [Trichonephila clavata]
MPTIRRSNLGRRTRNATNQANYRSNRIAQERDDGNERERIRISQTREARAQHSTNNRASLNRAAFSYDVSIDYSNYQCVVIGSMNSVCSHSVHLENGQRVYFTAQNAVQRAAQPPSTTLTSFFETCQNDDFAQTLLYSEMPKYYTWNQSSRRFIRRKQGKPVPGYTDVYSTDAIAGFIQYIQAMMNVFIYDCY